MPTVKVAVRNIGLGIALIRSGDDFRIEGPGLDGKLISRPGSAASTALPPQEETTLSFVLENIDHRDIFKIYYFNLHDEDAFATVVFDAAVVSRA